MKTTPQSCGSLNLENQTFPRVVFPTFNLNINNKLLSMLGCWINIIENIVPSKLTTPRDEN